MIKAAVCFFGLNRSLTHTVGSINNIFSSLKQNDIEFDVYASLMNPKIINNHRSNEIDIKIEDNFNNLIPSKHFEKINQDAFDEAVDAQLVNLDLHDYYNDNFSSIKNIVRELFSIKLVWLAASKSNINYDIVIFMRPDLLYSGEYLNTEIDQVLRNQKACVATPVWQKWGGLNDRLALCNLAGASVYGHRFDAFWKYAPILRSNLQAEALLLVTMIANKVDFNNYIELRAARVRANGVVHNENYEECGSNSDLTKQFENLF